MADCRTFGVPPRPGLIGYDEDFRALRRVRRRGGTVPYADRLAEKRRPALVISNRRLAPFGLIWVAMVTSADNAPWSCDVTITNLARAGLPAPSVVRAVKIACIEPARIERRAGRLDKVTAKAVAQKLSGLLGRA